jgi:hypothetical protein
MFSRMISSVVVLIMTATAATAQTDIPTSIQEIPQICNTLRNRCVPFTPTTTKGSSVMATNQVAVTTAPVLVVPRRIARQRVMLTVSGAVACAFGNSTVTLATGFPLQPVAGATITIDTAADVYSTCASATTIAFMELY